MNNVSDVFKDISGLSAPNAHTQEKVLKRIALRKSRADDFSLDWTCHDSSIENETTHFVSFCHFLQCEIMNGQITKDAAEKALHEIIDIYPDEFDIFDQLSASQKSLIEMIPTAVQMTIKTL
jgi:hypothetical protein